MFKDGQLQKAYFNFKGQPLLTNQWRQTSDRNLIFIKESEDSFPYKALVFTQDHQVYSGSYYPLDEVVTGLKAVKDLTLVSNEADCMFDVNWRDHILLENKKLFFPTDHKFALPDTKSYCNVGNGRSETETLDEFYGMIYQQFGLQSESHTLLTLEKHSSHLGPVSKDCVQVISDIKIDFEHKNGTAKLMSKKSDFGTGDVGIQFRNLLIDSQGRLHGLHTILVKTASSDSQRNYDPLMKWTVGHSISGTWKHGILEGLATIFTAKDKLIAVEGIVKNNCFHGPVTIINVQPLQQVL